MASFHIGQRLSCVGARCTVRYIGEVKDTKGSWLGVEWDDPTLGKHRGEYQGVTYFQCLSKIPTAGSFIRPTRPLDQTRGFLEALREKYVVNESLASETPDLIEISGKVVEEVGLDKVRAQLAALGELKVVLLDGLCVAGLGSRPWLGDGKVLELRVNEIAKTCPNVVELDLSRNLLENFEDVVGICMGLRKLRSLKLNFNRFMIPNSPRIERHEQQLAFDTVKDLHLDANLLSWGQIENLTSLFSHLETLSIALNDLPGASLPHLPLTLRSLDLSYNGISSLSSLEPIASLPCLSSLSLRSNSISTITRKQTNLVFACVEHLDLSSNLLGSQTSVSHVPPMFPKLKSLLTSHNPFTSPPPDVKEIHLLTIARIGTLTSLNYSAITPAERLNAEIFYLNQITARLSSSPASEEKSIISNEHPRYPELCKVYGAPPINRSSDATSASADPDRNTLAARLITFNLYMPTCERHKVPGARNTADDASENPSPEHHTIRLPRSITPYRLKAFTGDLFRLPPMQLRLVWESNEFDPVQIRPTGPELEDDDDNGVTKWNVPDDWVEEEAGEPLTSGPPKSKDEEGELISRGFVRREVELADGTREVGFWVEGREARVRVEYRGKQIDAAQE